MKEFRERNLDVLQNIEFGIVAVYRVEPSLLDMDAKDAVEALIRHYHAEEEQRTPPKRMLAERPERVFRSVQPFCEWRLGRSACPGETSVDGLGIPVSDLVKCLREIQKSISRWSRLAGRQGYLAYVNQYTP